MVTIIGTALVSKEGHVHGSPNTRTATALHYEEFESRMLLTGTVVFVPHEIDFTSGGGFVQTRSASAADVDGDGDLDVVSASRRENTITWHENTDGTGTFRPQPFSIATESNGADFVLTVDLDGDNDADVLFATASGNAIGWHENVGNGMFSESILISSDVGSPKSVAAADLDGDGDLDVLAASMDDDTVFWHENMDGAGTFGSQQVITDQADGAKSVYAADLDGDGDLDVLSASGNDDTIAWHENRDGHGNFSDLKMISIPNPLHSNASFVSAADLDGDGDLDVLTTAYRSDDISWYENKDGLGSFGPKKVIMDDVSRGVSRVDSVYAADLDSDGDLDVVAASEFGHRTYWAESVNGSGTFEERQPTGPMTELTGGSFQLVDLDSDGDVDILAASNHEGIIAWHENRLIGDSNDDGVFDTGDLTRVFQAGEYFDDIDGNSTFDEGDWNLDGDFNSSDLILAFQAGTYRKSAASASANFSVVVGFLDSQDDDDRGSAFVV